MKNLFVLVLLAVFSSTAMADRFGATVGVDSNYVYRGASINNGSTTLVAEFIVNNVIAQGLYLSADVAAWSLSSDMTSRAEAGVGFGGAMGVGGFDYALEVNRILQSNARQFDYTEVKGAVSKELNSRLTAFASVAQVVSGPVARNTYAEMGANIAITDRVWVRPLVAFGRDRTTGNTRINHGEVSVGYNLANGFSLYGLQTVGDNGLDNHNMVGLSYSF